MALKNVFARVLFFAVVPTISGCGTVLNSFYDEHETFVDTRNSEIGMNIDKVLSQSPRPGEKDYLKVVPVEGGKLEYRFELPHCGWAIVTDAGTKEIEDWRFLGDSSGCRYKRYYEVAW